MCLDINRIRRCDVYTLRTSPNYEGFSSRLFYFLVWNVIKSIKTINKRINLCICKKGNTTLLNAKHLAKHIFIYLAHLTHTKYTSVLKLHCLDTRKYTKIKIPLMRPKFIGQRPKNHIPLRLLNWNYIRNLSHL